MTKVPQSDPKGLQNGALGAPFDYFFLQKADFASDCIFSKFWTHFRGSGLPSFEDISNANVCWLEVSQKSRHFANFSYLLAKMCQNGCPNGGGRRSKKSSFFSLWSYSGLPGEPGHHFGTLFGCPWVHFLDFWAPRASFWHLSGCPGHHFGTLGAHQNDAPAMRNSMKMNPQTNLAGFIFLEF